MSKLVRSTVLSHIGIFNSDSSIFHWEDPHVMHNGKKRDVVILQVLPHDEERFLVEFIFNEDAEFVFGDDYDIVKIKKFMDERCENAINNMKKSMEDDTFVGNRYTIQPFEDFKDRILEKTKDKNIEDVKLKESDSIWDTLDRNTMYPYPEHFTLTDIKKQECISEDEQYMREAVCDKLSKALNRGDDPGEPGDDGYTYVEEYGENEQDD